MELILASTPGVSLPTIKYAWLRRSYYWTLQSTSLVILYVEPFTTTINNHGRASIDTVLVEDVAVVDHQRIGNDFSWGHLQFASQATSRVFQLFRCGQSSEATIKPALNGLNTTFQDGHWNLIFDPCSLTTTTFLIYSTRDYTASRRRDRGQASVSRLYY